MIFARKKLVVLQFLLFFLFFCGRAFADFPVVSVWKVRAFKQDGKQVVFTLAGITGRELKLKLGVNGEILNWNVSYYFLKTDGEIELIPEKEGIFFYSYVFKIVKEYPREGEKCYEAVEVHPKTASPSAITYEFCRVER